MLVLTRRIGEQIIIRDDIKISVLQVSRTKVRLGIVAPGNVRVFRQEMGERRREATLSVASSGEPIKEVIMELD